MVWDLRRICINLCILLHARGLVWTDKIEQLEIAQTRVIDMNAEPVQKDSKPKY